MRSAKRGARIAAVARAGALRPNQAAVLVKAEGGGGDAASLRHLADSEQVVHAPKESMTDALTSSSLELVILEVTPFPEEA